jgi:hypothetical protein
MSESGTKGELRPSERYGRNRRDFCRGSKAGSTRSVDSERTLEGRSVAITATLADWTLLFRDPLIPSGRSDTQCKADENYDRLPDLAAKLIR